MPSLKTVIPSVPEVARETLIVLAGAVVAAAVVGMLPSLRTWMKKQWDGSNPTV
jgi:hypothetical protein